MQFLQKCEKLIWKQWVLKNENVLKHWEKEWETQEDQKNGLKHLFAYWKPR